VKRWIFFFIGLVFSLGWAENEAFVQRVDWAWRLVKDFYYDPGIRGLDWDAIGERYRARAAEAQDWVEVYRLIEEMYDEIGDQHTAFLPPWEAGDLLSDSLCFTLPYPEAWEAPLPEFDSPQEEEDGEGTCWGGAEARVEDGVLYLRLPDLVAEKNYEILQKAIEEHDDEVIGYILDLRGNPGGLVVEMTRTAALFARGWFWRIVMRGMGALPEPTLPFWGEPPAKKPLAILIDRDVHSAAEGLAGALQNRGRAVLFGEKTAGNTEAVEPYCFPEGAVALVATGILAPLRGPTWEGRGVTPDFEVDPDEAFNAALRYVKNATQEAGPKAP